MRVRRFRNSCTVYVVFPGKKVPSHGALLLVPYTQCGRAKFNIFYVTNVTNMATLLQCATLLIVAQNLPVNMTPWPETPKCVHCGKVHEATSPVCSAISSEKQITRLDLEHPLHILRPAPHSELPRRRAPVRKFLGVRGISNLYDRHHQAFFLLLQLNHRLNRTSFFYVQRMSLPISRQL